LVSTVEDQLCPRSVVTYGGITADEPTTVGSLVMMSGAIPVGRDVRTSGVAAYALTGLKAAVPRTSRVPRTTTRGRVSRRDGPVGG